MQYDTAREAIERLEDEIERLALVRERCRKLSLAAKAAIALGAVWLVLTLTTLAPFEPSLLFASLAAIIGGIVLLGSNATTWTESEAALAAAEAARARLIEGIAMHLVEDGPTRVH